MKSFFFLSLVILGNICFASDKIIDYRFGNQITGSTLTIFQDGTVAHSERICCPPRTDQITERNLNSSDLKSLINLIEVASQFGQAEFTAGLSGEGSSSGTLHATSSNGQEFDVRTVEFGDIKGGPQTVRYNTSPEAREIEKLVFSIVLRKMNF